MTCGTSSEDHPERALRSDDVPAKSRYVSMDATTTLASRMTTIDTRTHASITMPLSSTRSSTSMRLEYETSRTRGTQAHYRFHSRFAPAQQRAPYHRRPKTAET